MPTIADPVEFTRTLTSRQGLQRCGNRVQLEDGTGADIAGLSSHGFDADYNDRPAVDTAAVVTLAALGAGRRWAIAGIYWSYDASPTGGNLTVTVAGAVALSLDITASGPGFLPFDPAATGGENQAIVATLTAGGGAVSGKLNLHAWVEDV